MKYTAYITTTDVIGQLMNLPKNNLTTVDNVVDIRVDQGTLILLHPDNSVNIWAPGSWVNVVTETVDPSVDDLFSMTKKL